MKKTPHYTFSSPRQIPGLAKYIFLLLLVLSLNSCATSSVGIAMSDIPLEGKEYQVLGPTTARGRWYTIDFGFLSFPLTSPPIDRVMEQARKSAGGNALRNIRFVQDEIVILFFKIHRFTLRAEAVLVTDPNIQKARKNK